MNLPSLRPPRAVPPRSNEHDACGVGFVAHIKGKKSHTIVEQGLTVLRNLTHRGAVGWDPKLSDGAGLLIQMPDRFFREEMAKQGVKLPPARPVRRRHGVPAARPGLAHRLRVRDRARHQGRGPGAARLARRAGRQLGSRRAGEAARAGDPPGVHRPRPRRHRHRRARAQALHHPQELRPRHPGAASSQHGKEFYVPSMSARTIVYKGMLLAYQVGEYYLDLKDARVESALALVHQRFSTNTFPSWDLAHPFRMICHNGEINTLRGNVNWIRARQGAISSPILGDDLGKIWPLIYDGQSDSASFDNALELLVMGGYSVAHAMMMMIPEAWEQPHADGSGAARVLRIPRGDDGAVGRPGVDRLHRRAPDRRHARPQRPAPLALHRHRRRPGHHGLGVRLPADPRGEDRQEVAPAAGQDVPRRPREGPHRRRQGAEGHARRARSPTPSGSSASASSSTRSRREKTPAAQVAGAAARPPAGLRLHAGRPEVHHAADGGDRRGADRLDGQRLAARGAVEQGQDALPLLQAAVRPGHQPGDRPDPRGAGDVAGVVHRPEAEPARHRRAEPAAAPGGRRSRCSTSTRWRRSATSSATPAASSSRCELDITYPVAWGKEAIEARLASLAAQAEDAVRSGYSIIVISDRKVDRERVAIPALLALSGDPPAPGGQGAAHLAPAWSSRPAARAKCIISRCSAATAPRRCIPISRSRRVARDCRRWRASTARRRSRTTSRRSARA